MQKVDNYEYELPSDFEDEEIDEDLAFTEEDKKKYAGWFGEDEHEEQEYKQQAKRQRGEFADLDSSSEDEADDDEVGMPAASAQLAAAAYLGRWQVALEPWAWWACS